MITMYNPYIRVSVIQLILAIAVVFMIIAHPKVYKIVNQVSKKIGSTKAGLVLCVITASVIVYSITASVLLYLIFHT